MAKVNDSRWLANVPGYVAAAALVAFVVTGCCNNNNSGYYYLAGEAECPCENSVNLRVDSLEKANRDLQRDLDAANAKLKKSGKQKKTVTAPVKARPAQVKVNVENAGNNTTIVVGDNNQVTVQNVNVEDDGKKAQASYGYVRVRRVYRVR